MKQTLLLAFFSFFTLILAAQEPIFVFLDTDTVYTNSCDSVDYCVDIGGINSYLYSEVTVNNTVVEAAEFCHFDTISLYGLGLVSQNGPWTVEAEIGGQFLNFNISALSELVDTFNLYYPDCQWEYEESQYILSCYEGHSLLGEIMISNSQEFVILSPSNISFPLGFILRLDYGENEIIMTHEDGYADTSIISVIYEEQILESIELNLSIGESESYFAESQCGSEMFTFDNLCEVNSTGAAELITNGNTYEIKAVAAGTDTICVQYTDEFGFSKRQDFYLSVLTSTEDIVDMQLDIYPNPTFDFINIATHSSVGLIEIRDINGQIVMKMNKQNNEVRIDAKDLLKGVYFVSIKNEKGRKQSSLFVKM